MKAVGMSNPTISLQTTLRRSGNLFAGPLGHETVMMDMTQGRYFELNTTATWLWNALESPQTISDLLDQLTEVFQVSADQCEQDIIAFIEGLLDRGWVEIMPHDNA
ncbi:hypothetical protein C2W62_46930 [Candidatus Entotheonella serta]|nr:hypothetical protein C2W62_46930 [Candidatus Entotheonella serta]